MGPKLRRKSPGTFGEDRYVNIGGKPKPWQGKTKKRLLSKDAISEIKRLVAEIDANLESKRARRLLIKQEITEEGPPKRRKKLRRRDQIDVSIKPPIRWESPPKRSARERISDAWKKMKRKRKKGKK
ncbi:MAG: hypothetical protein Q7S21_06940 [archaeon]|nr:hypothetical protein [archaeon]